MRTKTGLTAAAIRAAELYGVVIKAGGEDREFQDEDIEEAIRSAEDFYERKCQVRFGTKRVVSDGPGRGMVEGVDYDLNDTPYDYPPDFFESNRWGYLQLRQRPVAAVTALKFAFPSSAEAVFKLDPKWVRLDHKYGSLNIIPTSGPTVLIALNSFLFSAIGGGFMLPKSVLVDYTIGYTTTKLRGDYADLLKGIRLRTANYLLAGLGVALTGGRTSRSLSIDGLAESGGFQTGKYGPYSGMIEMNLALEKEILQVFVETEHGPRLTVM